MRQRVEEGVVSGLQRMQNFSDQVQSEMLARLSSIQAAVSNELRGIVIPELLETLNVQLAQLTNAQENRLV